MRRMRVRIQAVVIAVAMTVGAIFGNGNIPVMASDTDQMVNVQIQLTYGQTEARGMLDAINTFRQGEEAWAWDESDSEKVTYSNLGTLRIDPVLEQVAMLRAAEIALSYSHTRPNGQRCFTAYHGAMEGGYRAENIAVGYSSADAVFEGWQETQEKYSGQGHRRNMLNGNYVSIGIGHVTYQGIQYWVQEFSSKSTGESLAEANDSTVVEELEVLKTNIQELTLNKTEYSLTAGESVSLGDLKILAKITDFWSYLLDTCTLENDYTITVDNDQVVSVENGKLTAKSAGTTTLTVNALGHEMQIPVSVTGAAVIPTEEPDPSASSQPNVTETPSASGQPNVTETPSGSSQPNMTETPSGSSQPNVTKAPSASKQPSTTENPYGSIAPTETQKPDAPTVIGNPDKVKQPDSSVAIESEEAVTAKTGNPLKGKKVSGIKVKQKKKLGKVTIRYKKMKKADGYQITYAWNKKFTKHCKRKNTKSTSLTLSGLKRKKVYYFKVCAYTLDQNGKRRFSSDSKIVKFKIN